MKTPMQQLIEWIDSTCTPLDCVMKAKELLEEEYRQITGAYVQGRMEGHDLPYGMAYLSKLNSSEQEAEQYYNQTYNNENKQGTIQ